MTPESVEERLRALPEDPALPADGVERFAERRHRIGTRHRQWRANMPALDTLFDGDDHRAKALAGNVATEAHEILHAWARTEVELGGVPAAGRRRRLLREMDAFLGHWRQLAPRLFRARDWDPEARRVYDDFLEELLERGRAEAESQLRGDGTTRRAPGPLAWLRRPAAALGRLWRRVFEPTGEE